MSRVRVREKKMKNYFKYSILTTLIVLMAIGLVHGAYIGASTQVNPYESLPSAEIHFAIGAGPGAAGFGAIIDGDLSTSGFFPMGGAHLVRPNGDGFYKAWATSPTGIGFIAWYEETSNGDGTYYTSPATAAAKVTSTLEDPPADASGSITAVKVNFVARRSGTTGSITPMLRLGTTDQLGVVQALSASYTLYTQTVNRPGGGTWSWADIASLEAGVSNALAVAGSRVTQLYVTVEGPTTAYFELNGFSISPAPLTIGFVDLKMKYNVLSPTTDDTYAIQYAIGESAFTDVQPPVSGDQSKFDPPAVRSFSQIADPVDGIWDWTDISSLRLRITITQVGGSWDGVSMTIFDAWATIYEGPLPKTGDGTAGVSVQPPMVSVATGQEFFVDIYVQNVVDDLNWEFTVDFDGTIITPASYFVYWPWTVEVTADLSPDHVYIASGMPLPVPIGQAFAGNSPIARIYFTAIKGGTTGLTLRKGAAELILGDTTGAAIPRAIFDGRFSSAMILSAVDATDKPILITDFTAPISTNWHEIYPEPSHKFHLTGWTDNGDTVLSASDQIELTDEAGAPRFFHVDVVTITIHYTFKDPDTGAVAAEPESPTTEMPPGDPTGTRWIEIFPTYGRAFTITSWIDQGTVAGTFDPSDQFDFTYDDTPETTHWAHLDNVSTDIQVSEKAVIPEFPMFAIMPIALVFAVAYLWLKRRDKTPIKLYAKTGGALK